MFSKGTRILRNQRTLGDHPQYHIIKIDQNTEKSPGDMTRLAVTQTKVKDYILALLRKTCEQKVL